MGFLKTLEDARLGEQVKNQNLVNEGLAGYIRQQADKSYSDLVGDISNASDPVQARTIAEQALSAANNGRGYLDSQRVKNAYDEGYNFRFKPREYVASAEGGVSPTQLDAMAQAAEEEQLMQRLNAGLAGRATKQ